MSIFSDILGSVTSGLIPEEIEQLYTDPLPQIEAPSATFQPFTVTGPTGTTVTTATGDTTYTLDPTQAAMQQQLFGGAQGFFTSATQDTAAREADIYNRIRAAQAPEEQRQRLALEERLFTQGRGGVTTSQFGGTPEQLAMAKAQTEAQNEAMLAAMQQAQAEQSQQAALGGQFLQQSYAPQASLLSALSPALNVASMADVARRQQAEFDFEAQLGNIQGLIGQRTGLANLYSGIYSSLLGGLGGLLSGSNAATGKPWWLPSDVALKENITKVKTLKNGIDLYVWDWTKEAKNLVGDAPTFGVLAQEVQKVIPSAVTKADNGYLMVDYSKVLKEANSDG